MKTNPEVNFKWLVIKRIQGSSWEEIAQQVGNKVSSISSFYQRCITKFRPKIKEYLSR